MEEHEKSPLRIGWESARANTVPMVILWAVAVAMVTTYYLFPQVRQVLDPFVRWHLEWRWLSAFFWVGRDFSLARVRREWKGPFFRRIVLPNLVSNWIVWIPLVTVVFLFPFSLQIFVNGIVCSFWTLMCLQIGKRTAVASSIPAGTSRYNA